MGYIFFNKMRWSYSAFVKVNLGSGRSPECTITARWYGELPSVSGLACVFAKSRLTDASFLVQIKLSRWLNPGRRAGVFPSRYNCLGGIAKTMTTARRPAALLTLSR